MGIVDKFNLLHSLFDNQRVTIQNETNNIQIIKIPKNKLLYHLRHLNERHLDESNNKFERPKWFVDNPHDLFVVFEFRLWQNDDLEFKEYDLEFYKKNLIVDVYEVVDEINLIQFNVRDYLNLQNYISKLDNTYKSIGNLTPNFNNWQIANWFNKNKYLTKLDGWYEKSNDELKKNDYKKISEYMIIPCNKLKIAWSEEIGNIIDFDKIKVIK